MIVVLALMTAADLLDPAALGMDANPYLTIIILQLLVYALPAVFFCRLRGREYTARLRVRPFRISHIFMILLALVVMLSGCALLNFGMQSFLGEEAFSSASYAGVADAGIYAVLAFCILPAVAEEFLFRGILLAEYEAVSVPFAVFISSLFFGMLHLNFARLPAYVFSGIVLALVAYAARSVLASMLLHILHNIASLWTEGYVAKFSDAAGARSVLLVFILMCILLLSVILFFMEAQRIYQDYGMNAVPSPYVRRRKRGEPTGALEAVSVPPFVVFVVMFIVFTFILR